MAPTTDETTTQVIGSRLTAIAEEIGSTLLRAAYSPNIKQRADRSSAIFDASGNVIAEAQHSPMSLGSMRTTVMYLIDNPPTDGIHPGDMLLANDPYTGGGQHLPDFNVLAPVFWDQKIVAYVVNIGHHSDVGGMVAGSESGACKDIFQEGLRLPLVKLVAAGEVREDIVHIIQLNSRIPDERLGDVRAQIAANAVGVRGMEELCQRYGPEVIAASMTDLLAYGERRIRAAVAKIPDGVYEACDHLDGTGELVPIRLQLTVDGELLRFDFTGTHPQLANSRNVPLSATAAVVYAVVRNIVDPNLPANSGYYRAISVNAPEGSLLNPRPPGATGERALSGGVLGDVIATALSAAIPERGMACSGPHAQIIPSGINPRTGRVFVDYETFAGSYGARPYRDGMDAVRIHGSGGMNLPVESVEMNYPLLVERYELIQDSGGAGTYRGGMSVRRDYRILAPGVVVSVCGERQRVAARGLAGGADGKLGQFIAVSKGGSRQRKLKATDTDVPLDPGDVLRVESPAGGGYGPPKDRERSRVEQDLREERISAAVANRIFGVSRRRKAAPGPRQTSPR